MDLTLPFASLATAAALFGTGLPFLRRQQRARTTKKNQLLYLESLLVEARSSTFPVTGRRVWV
jgi:hypothetical protein